MAYDSIVSERALREIYLMPFMLAQKYAKPWSYMTASVLSLIHQPLVSDQLSLKLQPCKWNSCF
jgi:hypothetical protein